MALTAADTDLVKRLGLRAYRRPENPRATYVTVDPERQMSKSVRWNFGKKMGGEAGANGIGVNMTDAAAQHVPLTDLPVVLISRTGPTAPIPFSLAVQYVQNKGYKVWEEATEDEIKMQKTSKEHFEQNEALRKKKLLKAANSGMGFANLDDVANVMGEAIKSAVGDSKRGPGRPKADAE